jgi:hypothetical protein
MASSPLSSDSTPSTPRTPPLVLDPNPGIVYVYEVSCMRHVDSEPIYQDFADHDVFASYTSALRYAWKRFEDEDVPMDMRTAEYERWSSFMSDEERHRLKAAFFDGKTRKIFLGRDLRFEVVVISDPDGVKVIELQAWSGMVPSVEVTFTVTRRRLWD